MTAKAILATILSLMITTGTEPSMDKIRALADRQNAAILVYASASNKIYLMRKGQIVLVYPQTDIAKQLKLHQASDLEHSANPSLSPDGNYVAYVRRRSAARNDEAIALYNVRDNTSQDLMAPSKEVYDLHWSPTGKEIAFTTVDTYDNDYRTATFVINVLTQQISELHRGYKTLSLSWSPDGRKFVCNSEGGIFVVDRETGDRRKIGKGLWPSWSGSGQLIAFLSEDGKKGYTMKSDGSDIKGLFSYKPLIPDGLRLSGPIIWSPDEQYIVYHRWDGDGDQRKIYLMDLKSKKKQELFSGGKLEITNWQSTGN